MGVDVIDDVVKPVVTTAANVVTGGAAGAVVNSLWGEEPESPVLGSERDMSLFKRQHKFKYRFGRRKGLTPVELLGNGGGMSGQPGTANTSVLGNQQTQLIAQQQGFKQQAGLELAKTKMQTDAQRDIAEMQTGATTRGQDIQKQIADRIADMNNQRLQADLKQAAKQLDISHQELLYKTNKVATSSKEFQLLLKQLSMGPANLLVELTMRHHGISLSDNKFQNMSAQQRKRIIDEIVALSANSYVELSGVGEMGSKIYDAIKAVFEAIGIRFGEGVEPTQEKENLGNQGRNPMPWLPKYENFSKDFPGISE